ncbi:VOC family protein [Sulfurimonas sp. HSL-3221]|uniref:VOC family protein n=1 Tax=Sulfurimonadaceae TaxID=2771471 RepID=UPI001E2FA6A3|nr:VOC family protein [Sulfurimonas sp. HSL-3221]UFS61460.1 VOC family protein [Sulfurimonas sp. HSL-3221]
MANPTEQNGMFSWFELVTDDVEGSKAFYGELLGWQFETNTSTGMEYTLVKIDGVPQPVAGMFDKRHITGEETDRIPSHWGNYITVDDVDAAAERVAGLGGTIIVPPKDIPGVGRFAVIQDPQGAIVSIITYAYVPMD